MSFEAHDFRTDLRKTTSRIKSQCLKKLLASASWLERPWPHFLLFQVEGLPPGAETCSDVPYPLHDQLCTTLDLTRDQVKAILAVIKPNFVLFDVAYWIPALGRELGFKSVMYATVCAAGHSLRLVPAMKIVKGMSFEEMMQTPPGYPSSTVVPRPDEVAQARSLAEEFGSGLSKYDRLVTSKEESDAIALRTCREFEGPFIDYMAQQFGKPVLLAGPVLPEDPLSQLEEKWHKWLSKFEAGSVVFCAFGSQIKLKKNQFQELLLAFELSGLPFLVALAPPEGCSTIEEAIPEGLRRGFKQKVGFMGIGFHSHRYWDTHLLGAL
ncbi:hypothetical protein GH714_038653 [Hevea brasiliensis]|uniref:Anthocyanidin 3-O-glucosyltransferase n=1 Tax=Hevea brasiliensis TaxID=3981 RepID=A0A6A6MS49_HEVBR|nr:hypothetical protein GH714_038653 [Hevea brasiliensis]